MALLALYLFLAVGVSFLCSILEAALLSITPAQIAVLDESGSRTGRRLRRLKQDIDRPLAAILSLNTMAHTFGAAGVGAQAQVVFGQASVTIAAALVTLAILIFSEIIPKTLGVAYARSLAGFTAAACIVLLWLLWPLVQLSRFITAWLAPNQAAPTISREEFRVLAQTGSREGVFEEEESNIFGNLIRFSAILVEDVMTPRVAVSLLRCDDTVAEAMALVQSSGFSRYPVYGQSDEDIRGYVLKSDIMLAQAQDKGDTRLGELRRDVLFVPEFISLQSLFSQLLAEQEHFAVVVDEYGGFAGVVTMEDVLETLLGMEIVDESDTVKDLRQAAREQWKARARSLGVDWTATETAEDEDRNDDDSQD
ncbi:MAG TPA: hemolysin family protein [Wenzhouxiangella sp.]|nr:hemolysin family protein [Wenzhouxiangella sp.]